MAWTFYDRFGRARTATVTTHPVGSILAFGGSVAPPGWLLCQGQELSKASYPELSVTLGATYNVNGSIPITDGVNNFRVPDFRGHSPIGAGTPIAGSPGAGATYLDGVKTGERLHALTVAEVPRHTHGPGTLGTDTEAAVNVDSKTTGITGTNGGSANITIDGNTANVTINNSGAHTHSFADGSSGPTTFFGWDHRPSFNRSDLLRLLPDTADNAGSGPADLAGRVLGINAVFFNEIYMNQTIPGQGSEHSHTITQPNHAHTVTQSTHTHTITDPGHFHTVPAHSHAVTTGTTENGTAAGLGTGSPTHNNVSPVLPTNFIIKF